MKKCLVCGVYLPPEGFSSRCMSCSVNNLGSSKQRQWVSMKDNIDPKDNYDEGGISTRDFIEAKNLGYSLGNVVKYIVRHKKKNGLEDLKKAANYLQYKIDNYKKEEV